MFSFNTASWPCSSALVASGSYKQTICIRTAAELLRLELHLWCTERLLHVLRTYIHTFILHSYNHTPIHSFINTHTYNIHSYIHSQIRSFIHATHIRHMCTHIIRHAGKHTYIEKPSQSRSRSLFNACAYLCLLQVRIYAIFPNHDWQVEAC